MIRLGLSLIQIQLFLLIFLRVTAIVFSAPLFDSRSIPFLFKVGLALAASFFLLPVLKISPYSYFDSVSHLVIGIVGEVLMGLAIGFTIRLLFTAVELAGQLAGYQMGLAIANVFDPLTSSQVPTVAQLENIIAMLIFLVTNAHHLVLRAMVESFRIVPLLGFHFTKSTMALLSNLTGGMFVTAVKIAAPVMVALLLTSLTLGLVARVVPQMNVFIVAMPLKIIIGLFFIGVSLPYMAVFLEHAFVVLGNSLMLAFRTMQ